MESTYKSPLVHDVLTTISLLHHSFGASKATHDDCPHPRCSVFYYGENSFHVSCRKEWNAPTLV